MSWEDDQKFERDWHGDCAISKDCEMENQSEWKETHQSFEKDWWGNCCNTFGEETKQLVYARKMGLRMFHDGKSPFNFDLEGKSVVDFGGGPASLLLKCANVKGTIVDPCEYPEWVQQRYLQANVKLESITGESVLLENDLLEFFDESWIYNCLQHVQDPSKVICNARKCSKIVRIFEWINTGVSPGHPHSLTADRLDEWLGGEGKVDVLNDRDRGLVGTCYYGVFSGST